MERFNNRLTDLALGSLADFVSAAKAFRPTAWKSVERLKLACMLVESFPEWTATSIAESASERLVIHA